jgi:hypothetical protein
MPDDRPYQGRPSSDRPSFSGPRQFSGQRPNFNNDSRPPFRPAPRVEVPAAPMSHSLRLRDGDREIEVSGSAAFVRQVLDDLPAMWTRLHGEGSTRPARIDLPGRTEAPAPAAVEAPPAYVPESAPEPRRTPAVASNGKHTTTRSTPDDKVLAVLKESTRPLAVAAIRKRLGGSFTPQQVRRILERNAPKVSVTDDRPATYRLR